MRGAAAHFKAQDFYALGSGGNTEDVFQPLGGK